MFPIDLVTATLKDVVRALSKGQLTSEDLVAQYLARIEVDNYRGHKFHAVIETAPKPTVMQRAHELDLERRNGKVRGPLHGVPILVKDTIYTDPSLGMQTTAGCEAFVGSSVPGNAIVIDKLMTAGAIIIGKANMTILSNVYGSDTKCAWSPRGGTALNPYVASISPQGSSSGSAVGLAVGFCAGAVGSETVGSISYPAEQAGLYALKPSFGLVPTEGVISISFRQDVLGPFGKCVWDVAAMLSGMVSNLELFDFTSLVADMQEADLSNFNLGILRWPSVGEDLPEERVDLFDRVIEQLKLAHPQSMKVDPARFVPLEDNGAKQGFDDNGEWQGKKTMLLLVIDLYEAMTLHLTCIKNCSLNTSDDLIEWNTAHPEQAFFNGGPETEDSQRWLKCARDSKGLKGLDTEYNTVLEWYKAEGQKMLDYMEEEDLDALLMPSFAKKSAMLSASIGFPMAVIPCGLLSDGEPCGIWVMAKPEQDRQLLRIMAACEKVFPPRAISGCSTDV